MWETETKLKHNYTEDWHLKNDIKYWVSTTSCIYLCVSRKSLTRWLKENDCAASHMQKANRINLSNTHRCMTVIFNSQRKHDSMLLQQINVYGEKLQKIK